MKAYLDQCDSRYPLTNGAVFEFCGIRFRLRTNSEDLFTYLRRFLDPFIAPVSPQTQVRPEELLYDLTCRMVDDLPPLPETRRVLIRDGAPASQYFGEACTMDGMRVILTEGTLICFDAPRIFMSSVNPASMRKYARLLIRDIVQKQFEKNGGVTFHASSVIAPDGGMICIMGNKGSGKTTVLLEYLIRAKVYRCGLDRVMMEARDGGIMAYGWPILYNIGVGTLSRFAELEHLIPEEIRKNNEVTWENKKKVVLEPFDLPYEARPKGKLSAILFPKISDAPHGLRRIDPESALAHLRESCYTPNDPNFINWHQYVTYDAAWETQNAQTLMETMVRSVPCYELKWKEEIQLL